MAEQDKSQNKEREQRILDAAARLIMHYGFDKTTVSDIAEEAGISKGAIYLHYDSKDTLFEALLWREVLRYGEVWMQNLAADPQGGTLAGIYRSSLYAIKASPFMRVLFSQDPRVLGSYLRKDNTVFKQHAGLRTDFVRMMQEMGAIRQDIAPELIAHIMNLLSYGLVGIVDILNAEDIPPMDETIEAIGKVLDWALTPPQMDPQVNQQVKDLMGQIMNRLQSEQQETPQSED